jgi:biopolymer transport protein ExbB
MWPLLVLALAVVALIVERTLALRQARINIGDFLAKIRAALLVKRDVREAVSLCERQRGPVAAVIKAGLARHGRPRSEVERGIESAAASESGRLERGLPLLSSLATVAPLIGFLGTVIGMIRALSGLGPAGLASPGVIAGGLSEAMIAAAAGLLVAIPAQLGHAYLLSGVNRFLADLETASNTLMDTLAEMEGEGQAAAPGGRSTT